MKKILALILALCLVLSLCACAKQSGSGNKDGKKTLTMWCIATESDANQNSRPTIPTSTSSGKPLRTNPTRPRSRLP